ncbi:hypothetical protein K9N68_39080 (plasmid) [Kovacikia minuta CCNUW1]|uniref:hypothetical protein n=1 Tax=Kovacikia minuta TaxID=2931930 RepID=UPI001CCDC511|nr:hypothetical protein [Kovacikia minuta]UBF30150.1 hypothetical protein K9N68_39080 [Kovacikia minuta CCNUW1]
MSFLNKTIVITAASTEIRRSLAIYLAQQQANLVLATRNQSGLENVVAVCTEAGGKAIPLEGIINLTLDKR